MSDLSFEAAADDTADSSARRMDDLVLLTTPAVRARRHPRAILAMWAWQTVLALLVSWPTAGLVRAAWSGDVRGDAALWAPGSHALLDWLWHDARGLGAVVNGAELALLVGAVVGLVPMAALMIALAYATRDRKSPGFSRCIAGGLRVFPSMLLLLVLVALIQALVVGSGALLGSAVEGWTHSGMGEARAQQLEGLILVVFLGIASCVGVAHDLARAALVRFKVKGIRALALGARAFRLSPLSLWWSWAWRALASIAPVLAAGALAGSIGGRGGIALVFLVVLHQAVIAVRVALRASWLARALRAVDAALRRVR